MNKLKENRIKEKREYKKNVHGVILCDSCFFLPTHLLRNDSLYPSAKCLVVSSVQLYLTEPESLCYVVSFYLFLFRIF